eukprot:3612854-Ditylum_brightwellii.AAC.1
MALLAARRCRYSYLNNSAKKRDPVTRNQVTSIAREKESRERGRMLLDPRVISRGTPGAE